MLMTILKFFLIALIALGGLVILVFAIKSKKPFRTIATSGIAGVIGLIIISLTSTLTGVSLAINVWSVACAFFVGIPGVILMLVLKTVWFV